MDGVAVRAICIFAALVVGACNQIAQDPQIGSGRGTQDNVASLKPTPSRQPTPRSRFKFMERNQDKWRGREELVQLIKEHVEVPIVLPPVPQKHFNPKRSGIFLDVPGPEGTLSYRWKNGKRLNASYGTTSLMNCGGGSPRVVRIGKETGLAVSKPKGAAVIWPTTKTYPSAAYGLSGHWPVKQLLEWAREMQREIEARIGRAELSGC